jgi:hypothetical protein
VIITEGQWSLAGNVMVLIVYALGYKRHNKKIQEIHIAMNSRLDQLVVAARKEGHALGVKEEKESHKI